MTPKKDIIIDAGGMTIGRVATAAAKALMGKTSASYEPHILSTTKVVVMNAGKIRVPEKKRRMKSYARYSGYPGGLKNESLGSLVGRKGNGAAVIKAVERMLPRNSMRKNRLKLLTITD